MLRLIVNPGTDQAWEIPLPPGVTTLGSDPAGGFPIAHDTVAAAHCEIRVSDSGITVKDLDSSCGTFLNHEPVREAPLLPGQTITLGEVELRLTADASGGNRAPEPGTPPLAPPIPEPASRRVSTATRPPVAADTGGPVPCKHHPKARARWRCAHCQAHYCDLCIALRRAGGTARHLCRTCGGECEPVAVEDTRAPEESDFFARLPGAFGYPFKGNGLILLVGGAVFLLIVRFLGSLAGVLGPYGGLAALVPASFGSGYLFNYAKSIITSSAIGANEPPDWPDYTGWQEDILAPLGQLIALAALSIGPALILRWWQPVSPAFTEAATVTALGLGLLLAPMGMLALAIFDSVAALNPVSLLAAIGRIPLHYAVAAAAFELVVGAYLVVGNIGVIVAPGGLFVRLLPVPGMLGVLADLLGLYLIVVAMRILGLLHLTDQERLGWV